MLQITHFSCLYVCVFLFVCLSVDLSLSLTHSLETNEGGWQLKEVTIEKLLSEGSRKLCL